ncbi:hypothetical protein CHS0354_022422 [Potamilus streckersoni]|uniref:Sulfhydryl light chain n=1 Tax=Potamilus streckersoni TaxID=2493646 RepID=A0AAE0W4E6_9BIVA|nr:hypothetical protein CHS0354_022422 [Potamilus streckersoni]
MSGKRQSNQATDDREMILECKAAYLSVFDDIKDEIDSKEKLVQVLQQAGRNPTSRTISKYWKKSTDNLSFDDFVDICRKEPPTSVDDLMKAFRKIDLNGDGFLSVEELMKVLTTKGEKMSRSEVEKMINEVDEDGNGKLDYGEFCNMVMSTTEECKRKSLKMMERKERKKKKADKGKTELQTRHKFNESFTKDDIETGQMGSRRSLISIDDLPKPSPRARKDKPKASPSVKSTRLSEPQNLKEWTHVTSKGAFFFEEEEIVTHLYSLEIPDDTNVYITIQPTEIPGGGGVKPRNTVDTMLYLLRSRPDENGKYLVTFTEQRDSNGKYVLRCDLPAGKYQLIPFTTGCRFKQRASQPKKEAKIIENGKDETIVITKAFRKALEDIFHICDLDGNGYLSRDEFNWFNMRTSGEEIADDEWQVVEERVELKDGEITLNGFIQLNEMEAEDSEGDTDDLWMTLSSMGFNKALIIDELCTYKIDVYTENCDDAEFKVTGIESLAEKVEAEVCQSVIDKGKATPVKGMKDLVMYTYTSGTRAAIVFDNKSRSTVKMKVDCTKSKNCVSHRGDLEYVMDISSHSTMVAHHILPEDDSSEWVLHCTDTVLK